MNSIAKNPYVLLFFSGGGGGGGSGPPCPLSGSSHVKPSTFCCDTMLWQEHILAYMRYIYF